MLIKDFLVDYKSYTQAKTDIVQKIQSFDTRDKENQKLIDEIYTVLHDTDVTDRFMQATTASLSKKEEYNEEKIICARAYFVFVAIDKKGKPIEVPKLIAETKIEKRNQQSGAEIRKRQALEEKRFEIELKESL